MVLLWQPSMLRRVVENSLLLPKVSRVSESSQNHVVEKGQKSTIKKVFTRVNTEGFLQGKPQKQEEKIREKIFKSLYNIGWNNILYTDETKNTLSHKEGKNLLMVWSTPPNVIVLDVYDWHWNCSLVFISR